MLRVIHFEVCADSPERAAKFYEDAFGWKIRKWEGPSEYWLMVTGDPAEYGINGAIKPRGDSTQPVLFGIHVPSVDEYIEKVLAAGGSVVIPKTEVPGVGFSARCADSEGNLFQLFEGLVRDSSR
jgi:uncharacterized protein